MSLLSPINPKVPSHELTRNLICLIDKGLGFRVWGGPKPQTLKRPWAPPMPSPGLGLSWPHEQPLGLLAPHLLCSVHTPASGAELLHLDLFLVPQLHLAEPVLHLVQKVHDIGCFAGGTGIDRASRGVVHGIWNSHNEVAACNLPGQSCCGLNPKGLGFRA